VRGTVISVDDTIRPGVTMESLSALKPVFPDWGEASTTAGNASGIGDGAALCILTTRERALAEGMQILGKWVGSAVVGMVFCRLQWLGPDHATGVEPRYMGIGPIAAISKVLSQFGLSKEDVNVYEVCGF
jgi:acetyl-CoA acyltransferase 1